MVVSTVYRFLEHGDDDKFNTKDDRRPDSNCEDDCDEARVKLHWVFSAGHAHRAPKQPHRNFALTFCLHSGCARPYYLMKELHNIGYGRVDKGNMSCQEMSSVSNTMARRAQTIRNVRKTYFSHGVDSARKHRLRVSVPVKLGWRLCVIWSI
jgi:hypothetical protein